MKPKCNAPNPRFLLFTITLPRILFPYHLPCQSCIFIFEKRKDIVPNPERNECKIKCRY